MFARRDFIRIAATFDVSKTGIRAENPIFAFNLLVIPHHKGQTHTSTSLFL